MVSLNMNIPIWRKKVNAGIQEARLLESATQHRKRKMQFALESASEMAIFSIEDALRRYTLYEASLIPQAQSAYESLQSQYANSSWDITFLDVLDSIQTLVNFELEHVRAGRDWRIGTAELEYLMGGIWPDAENMDSARPMSVSESE
jgi:outer membrane protein TolC